MSKVISKAEVFKVDETLGLAIGWSIICTEDNSMYFDVQEDHIPEDAMLKAAADFMQRSRSAKAMHAGEQIGDVVFAFPMTQEIAKALGITTKRTGLIIAMRPDAATLAKFKSGEYTGFSIGGARIKDEDFVQKYNENHGDGGRFSSGDGGGSSGTVSASGKYRMSAQEKQLHGQLKQEHKHATKELERVIRHGGDQTHHVDHVRTLNRRMSLLERGPFDRTAKSNLVVKALSEHTVLMEKYNHEPIAKALATDAELRKYNENHDEAGRFSEGDSVKVTGPVRGQGTKGTVSMVSPSKQYFDVKDKHGNALGSYHVSDLSPHDEEDDN